MKYDELSRDEGSTNSSRLRIRLQRTDECQNCLGNYLKRKEMGEIHDTLVQETFFFKTKCLFLFCPNWLINIVNCSRKFNGLTNFELNCTVRVQSSTKVRIPVNQRRIWSGEKCSLPLK
jgi:hypothetical protein